ncbi:hypothetical protein L1787_20455 [Acuticoccus sp. M5D2P5]|uniref:hypothetical protein n=1 Tax=Acuticoccus kalidii TaxID=2910977 RepID=UPI001F1657AF|nr:hypothetical protein [Acuticoccus kalidii]MCF3935772.1 hypothetical protein [Acuticoccus kalidii]
MDKTSKKTAEFLRFLITHAVIGIVGAVAMVGLCLATDFFNLWTLVSSNDSGVLAVVVMTAFFAITFASVQMGFAIMLSAEDGHTPRARKLRVAALPAAARPDWAPIPVRARTGRVR